MDRTARRDPKNRDHKMTPRRSRGARAELLSQPVFHGRWGAKFHRAECHQSGILQTGKWRDRIRVAGCIEDLCELARAQRRCAVAFAAFRRRQFQVPADADRSERDSGALEALRELWWIGELGEALGQKYVDVTFGPDGKAAHVEDGGCAGEIAGQRHPGPFLDERRNQEAGEGKAARRFATRLVIRMCAATTVRS